LQAGKAQGSGELREGAALSGKATKVKKRTRRDHVSKWGAKAKPEGGVGGGGGGLGWDISFERTPKKTKNPKKTQQNETPQQKIAD